MHMLACRVLLDAWREKLRKEKALTGAGDYMWPVLVIDEANRFMAWTSDEHKAQLAGLLGFLVHISKETRRCHVLMATSESDFQSWLDNGTQWAMIRLVMV